MQGEVAEVLLTMEGVQVELFLDTFSGHSKLWLLVAAISTGCL